MSDKKPWKELTVWQKVVRVLSYVGKAVLAIGGLIALVLGTKQVLEVIRVSRQGSVPKKNSVPFTRDPDDPTIIHVESNEGGITKVKLPEGVTNDKIKAVAQPQVNEPIVVEVNNTPPKVGADLTPGPLVSKPAQVEVQNTPPPEQPKKPDEESAADWLQKNNDNFKEGPK